MTLQARAEPEGEVSEGLVDEVPEAYWLLRSDGHESVVGESFRFEALEEEGSEYSCQTVEILGGKVIAAKFFTRRVLNMEAIARTFKQLWATKKGFEVKDLGNHVVLFVFSDKTDADRVLLGEPWSYDKYLVSLRRLERTER
ncbi:hypothetical protein SO802_028798 [Lithocarpus litseifolius]|uniref:DUF4283 domain-containing protein n=1 Tax=Lithocarpus litseifolius TaxID=425828 RepID=A0AAW2BUF8_9ROSI